IHEFGLRCHHGPLPDHDSTTGAHATPRTAHPRADRLAARDGPVLHRRRHHDGQPPHRRIARHDVERVYLGRERLARIRPLASRRRSLYALSVTRSRHFQEENRMLTQEENERLTQVGPGTPGGEFLRRYWTPAALSEELPAGGAPIPVR